MTDTDVVKLFSSRASKSNHSAHRLLRHVFRPRRLDGAQRGNLGFYDCNELISIGATMLSYTGGRTAVRRDVVRRATRRVFSSGCSRVGMSKAFCTNGCFDAAKVTTRTMHAIAKTAAPKRRPR